MPSVSFLPNNICTIKQLPQQDLATAAARAILINPSNAPSTNELQLTSPDGIPQPDRLALLSGKRWSSGGVGLTVGFLDDPPADLRKRILSHMNAWGTFANVRFSETGQNPQVRISRTPKEGHWSFLGTDILAIAANAPTMNLDSFTMETDDSEFFRVIRHETGHTLGFPHEHLRSEIVARIDRDKAIAYFGATQGWSPQKVIAQVLTPLDNSALIATAHADPQSIMCYWLPGSIMKDGIPVQGGSDIDTQDSKFAASVYPKVDGRLNAALIHPRNGKAYFFRGNQYQRFDFNGTEKVDKVGTIGVSGWPGVWSGLDAALIHPKNGKAYFFRGNQYQRFDFDGTEKVDKVGTIGVSGWPGVWSGIQP